MNNKFLKEKIIDLIDNNKLKEAELLALKDKELKDFIKIQRMLKETLPEFKMEIIPQRIKNNILSSIYEEIDNKTKFNPLQFLTEAFSFLKLNYSAAISVILIFLFVGFYYINPNKEKLSYYSYKVKSNIQYLMDKVSGAKDILVFMFDKNIEKVYDNLINKEKKNKEDRKWQIKTEKNQRESLFYSRSFLG